MSDLGLFYIESNNENFAVNIKDDSNKIWLNFQMISNLKFVN